MRPATPTKAEAPTTLKRPNHLAARPGVGHRRLARACAWPLADPAWCKTAPLPRTPTWRGWPRFRHRTKPWVRRRRVLPKEPCRRPSPVRKAPTAGARWPRRTNSKQSAGPIASIASCADQPSRRSRADTTNTVSWRLDHLLRSASRWPLCAPKAASPVPTLGKPTPPTSTTWASRRSANPKEPWPPPARKGPSTRRGSTPLTAVGANHRARIQ